MPAKKKPASESGSKSAPHSLTADNIAISDQKPIDLNEFEASMVSLGMSFAAAFSLPKSIGAIYGLAYASVEPLSLYEFADRLNIAVGSSSQGLRFLQRMGAIKPVRRSDQRKTLYAPEESMRRVVLGILNENFIPKLTEIARDFPDMRSKLEEVDDPAERDILIKRMDNLESWASKSSNLLPWISKLLGAPLKK